MHLLAKTPEELRKMKEELASESYLAEFMGIEGVVHMYPTTYNQLGSVLTKFNQEEIGLLDLTKWMIQNDLVVFLFGNNMCQYSLQELYTICEKCEQSSFWFSTAQRRVIQGWVKGELINRGMHVN